MHPSRLLGGGVVATQPTVTESLEERLRKQREGGTRMIRGASGQLEEVTGEEVSTLAGKLGQQTPTTPLGTSGMGATPDQAKMAGTPAQRAGAQQAAPAVDVQAQARTQDTQAGAQRLRDVSGMGTTAAQQATIEKSENLKNLGQVGDRIHKMMVQQAASGAQAGAQQNATLSADTESALAALPAGTDAATKQNVTNLLGQLEQAAASGDSAATQKLLADLENAGLAGASQYLSGDAAAAVAASAPELQTIDTYKQSGQLDQVAAQLGYQNFDEVAGLLGITPEEMGQYNLTQLNDLIQGELDREFSQTEELRRAATDPAASPQQQAEARARLREMGVVGIRSSEEQVNQLQQEIESGQTTRIGGRDYTLEELFADENITSLAQSYFDMDEVERAAFSGKNPELAQVFGKHEAVLQDAVEGMGEEFATYTKTQESNRKAAGVLTSAIPPDVFQSSFLREGTPVGDLLSQYFDPTGKMLASGTDLAGAISSSNLDPGTKGVLSSLFGGGYSTSQMSQIQAYMSAASEAGLNPLDLMRNKAEFDQVANLSRADFETYKSVMGAGIPRDSDVDSLGEMDSYLDKLFGGDGFPLSEIQDAANRGIPGATGLLQEVMADLGLDKESGWSDSKLGSRLSNMSVADKLKFKNTLAGKMETYKSEVAGAKRPEPVVQQTVPQILDEMGVTNQFNGAISYLDTSLSGARGVPKDRNKLHRSTEQVAGLLLKLGTMDSSPSTAALKKQALGGLTKALGAISTDYQRKGGKTPSPVQRDSINKLAKQFGLDLGSEEMKAIAGNAETARVFIKLMQNAGGTA